MVYLTVGRPMSTWKRILLLNGGMLIGIFVSIFLTPPDTPVWLWATISVVVMAVMNFLALRRLRMPDAKPKSSLSRTIVIWLGVLVLLLDLAYRYLSR